MMVLYVRLAKRLGVHPSHVSKVAAGKAGKTISAEVSRALQKELQRIERMSSATKTLAPFPDSGLAF